MKYLFQSQKSSMFLAHGFQSEPIASNGGEEINLSSLSTVLRVLLVTDGTVTKTLEAMFCETIKIELVQQEYFTANNGVELLERDVRLLGVKSGREYAYARSYLNTAFMPEELVNELKSGRRGIGWLMRRMGQEQYRDVVEVGYCKELPQNQRQEGYEDGLYRTYVIKIGGSNLIQITEHYPISLNS